MKQENYNQFLSNHNVDKISQLDKDGTIEFAKTFMDEATIYTIDELDEEIFGIPPDWTEVANWVEKAFLSNKSLLCSIVIGESPILKYMSSDRLEYSLFSRNG